MLFRSKIKEWNSETPPLSSSSIICRVLSSMRPRNKTMSSPMYFDMLAPIFHKMSSSTLSNKAKFFSHPTHASLSHFPLSKVCQGAPMIANYGMCNPPWLMFSSGLVLEYSSPRHLRTIIASLPQTLLASFSGTHL